MLFFNGRNARSSPEVGQKHSPLDPNLVQISEVADIAANSVVANKKRICYTRQRA